MRKSRLTLHLYLIFSLTLAGCTSNQKLSPAHSVPAQSPTLLQFNLYSNKNSGQAETDISNTATIAVFKPKTQTVSQTSVIIFPGGGYRQVVLEKEGVKIAQVLNQMGITAFVVNYRLPDATGLPEQSTRPLKDAQQAIYFVRSRAEKFNLDPNKIGVMGFSAGGHLASTAATHFDQIISPDLKNENLRPDFQALIYPVISMKQGITHPGSRERLLGQNASLTAVELYSNESQVTRATPKTFIVHAIDDQKVPVENALLYTQALANNKVQAALILLENGGHGFALKHDFNWMQSFKIWLKNNHLLE